MQLLTWPYKSLKSLSTMVQSSLTMKRKKKIGQILGMFAASFKMLISGSAFLCYDKLMAASVM